MTRTRRTIGIGAFIVLAALGTGWALEKASSNSQARSGAALDPTRANDAETAPITRDPADPSVGSRPVTTDSTPEYDRSDLLLSQG